ncbi:MAG: COX15/CtaA family protein [Balneolaceae bacterium]
MSFLRTRPTINGQRTMNPTDRKQIRFWYWSGAAMIFLILVIGGITRLTQSGLSMVEWNPLMGMFPPLSESEWMEIFEKYRDYPEYQQRNMGMSLTEFKFIFFWEYVHRAAGRLLALVFILPFGYFLAKKKFSSLQLKRALILMGLGLAQGFMGWFMVQSGLVDVPFVSPYRLAAHLLLAFSIFGCCVWFALDLTPGNRPARRQANPAPAVRGLLWVFLIVLIVQVAWGAFVAGLHAGHVYNTFPKMNQYWIPPEAWLLDPLIRNFFENTAAVQWIHRVLGTLLVIISVAIWARLTFSGLSMTAKKWGVVLLGFVLAQYMTGVFILLYHVPISLGVLHQAMALILFGISIGFYHYFYRTYRINTGSEASYAE